MEFTPVSLKNEWFHVPIGIFHHNVYAFVGSLEGMRDSATGEVFEKFGCSCSESDAICKHIHLFCESHKGQNNQNAGDAFGRDNFSIIRVADMTTGDIGDIAILGHECLHVAAGLIDYLNIQEGPNNELLCYTHEYIFRELLEHMCKCGLGRKYDNHEKPAKPSPVVPPSAPGCARALDQRLLEVCAKKAAASLEVYSIDVDEVGVTDGAFFVKIKRRDAEKIRDEIVPVVYDDFRTRLIAELKGCGVDDVSLPFIMHGNNAAIRINAVAGRNANGGCSDYQKGARG